MLNFIDSRGGSFHRSLLRIGQHLHIKTRLRSHTCAFVIGAICAGVAPLAAFADPRNSQRECGHRRKSGDSGPHRGVGGLNASAGTGAKSEYSGPHRGVGGLNASAGTGAKSEYGPHRGVGGLNASAGTGAKSGNSGPHRGVGGLNASAGTGAKSEIAAPIAALAV